MGIQRVLLHCVVSLLVRGFALAALPYRRVCEFSARLRGRGIGKADVKIIGSIRLFAPEPWLKVIDAAIVKLRSEDPTLYSAINSCRKFLVFAGGTPKSDPQFELGIYVLSKAFVKSEDALVSLFVFWRFFEEGNSLFQRADPGAVKNRKVQAREQTAKWLESHGRPPELVQWLREGGVEKRSDPPEKPKLADKT